jgi:hypothetical protein
MNTAILYGLQEQTTRNLVSGKHFTEEDSVLHMVSPTRIELVSHA